MQFSWSSPKTLWKAISPVLFWTITHVHICTYTSTLTLIRIFAANKSKISELYRVVVKRQAFHLYTGIVATNHDMGRGECLSTNLITLFWHYVQFWGRYLEIERMGRKEMEGICAFIHWLENTIFFYSYLLLDLLTMISPTRVINMQFFPFLCSNAFVLSIKFMNKILIQKV